MPAHGWGAVADGIAGRGAHRTQRPGSSARNFIRDKTAPAGRNQQMADRPTPAGSPQPEAESRARGEGVIVVVAEPERDRAPVADPIPAPERADQLLAGRVR